FASLLYQHELLILAPGPCIQIKGLLSRQPVLIQTRFDATIGLTCVRSCDSAERMPEYADASEIKMTGEGQPRRAGTIRAVEFVEDKADIPRVPLQLVEVPRSREVGDLRPALRIVGDPMTVRIHRDDAVVRMRDGGDDVAVTDQILDLCRVN